MKIAYTLGYLNFKEEKLLEKVTLLNGILVDIRHNPHSEIKAFDSRNLAEKLGRKYHHMIEFSEVNGKLYRPKSGILLLEHLGKKENPPILMCSCSNWNTCHRKMVAQYIETHNWLVVELPA